MTGLAGLTERPSSRARRLMWRNLLGRSRAARLLAAAAGGLLAASVSVALVGARPAAVVAYPIAAHPVIVFAVVAVLFAVFASRRRRLATQGAPSWLAALPIRDPPLERAALDALALLAALAWALGAVTAAARVPGRVVEASLVVSAAGAVAGFWLGWFVPRARRAAGRSASRSSGRRARAGWATHAALTPLGYWALGEARWRSRPGIMARWLAPVLLAIPMGSTGIVVIGAVAACLTGLNLVWDLLAIVRVAFAASWWLAPTGVGSVRFAAAGAHLALLRQAAICVLALAAVYVFWGARPLGIGAIVAGGWLVLNVVVGALAGAYALGSRSIAASRLQRRLA